VEAEFYREDAPDEVLGRAVWNEDGVQVSAEREDDLNRLHRIFRPVAVVIEDPSLRSFGTSGPVQLSPGDLRWFRAAAESRGAQEGLRVRLVPGAARGSGWDPAGTYRTFNKQAERLAGEAEPTLG
jgi:hypothetical protein